MEKNTSSHFVVEYNHTTKKFEIDEDTTWAKFDDGRVFIDGKGWLEPDSQSKLGEEVGIANSKLSELLNAFDTNKEISVPMLSINKTDIENCMPEMDEIEEENFNNLTKTQLEEIAELAREELERELGDTFWDSWTDAVNTASRIVLGSENESFDLLDKTISEVDLSQD